MNVVIIVAGNVCVGCLAKFLHGLGLAGVLVLLALQQEAAVARQLLPQLKQVDHLHLQLQLTAADLRQIRPRGLVQPSISIKQ